MAKYRVTKRGLASDARGELGSGSLLITEQTAAFYGEILPRLAKGTLADLGCGASPMRPFYQPLVDQAFSVDWPSSLHAGDLDVFANLNHGVPIRTGAVDTIVASDLLEHLVEPAAFLAECHRILRPQGHLVGNVPFMYWLHEAPHDYFRYTEHGLRFLLGRAGFAQVAIEPLAGGLDIPVDVISKLLTKIPVVGDWIARGLQRFWMLVRRFPPLKKAYPVFPLCYGFTAQK